MSRSSTYISETLRSDKKGRTKEVATSTFKKEDVSWKKLRFSRF